MRLQKQCAAPRQEEQMPRLTSFHPSATRWAVAAALIVCFSLAGQARAAPSEARQWVAQGDAGASLLIYGTPESDDVLLSLTCDHSTKALTLWYVVEPVRAKDPESLAISLRSQAGTVALVGKGSRSELDNAYSLEVATEFTPELEKVLGGAKALSILVEDRAVEVPMDATAQDGIALLKKGCGK
jgi:hypothetical protein